MNCMKVVIDDCVGLTIPYTNAGFQKFVGEAISASTGVINILFTLTADSMSEHKIKGFNALRCAIVSGGFSSWYFIASTWWWLYTFGLQGLLEDQLDKFYPHICTCKADVDTFA